MTSIIRRDIGIDLWRAMPPLQWVKLGFDLGALDSREGEPWEPTSAASASR